MIFINSECDESITETRDRSLDVTIVIALRDDESDRSYSNAMSRIELSADEKRIHEYIKIYLSWIEPVIKSFMLLVAVKKKI